MTSFSLVGAYVLSLFFCTGCLAYYVHRSDVYLNNVLGVLIILACPIFNVLVGIWWLYQGFKSGETKV